MKKPHTIEYVELLNESKEQAIYAKFIFISNNSIFWQILEIDKLFLPISVFSTIYFELKISEMIYLN